MTNAKRQANRRYDKEHYTVLAVKMSKDHAERYRALCAAHGMTVNAALSKFIKQSLEWGNISDKRIINEIVCCENCKFAYKRINFNRTFSLYCSKHERYVLNGEFCNYGEKN